MALFGLDDLITPVTKEEVAASIYEVLATIGVNTTVWKQGAVVRTMIAAVSVVLAALSTLQAKIARSGFLELSESEWLTLVARYVYGVLREESTFATGAITLVNSGGGVFTLDADDLTFGNLTTGKTYRNTGAVALGAGETLTIPIRAVEAGSASSSVAGAITVLETVLTGVTCSNGLAVIGQDEERDATLRVRCYEKLGSLSPNGPWDAYAYAARAAKRTDGFAVGITRVRSLRDGYGNVTTFVATATGGITGAIDDPSTDLGAVQLSLVRNAEPLAVSARAQSAEPVTVPVTYELWVQNTSGLTNAQVQTLVEQRMQGFMPAQPIGGHVIDNDPGKLFHDHIRTTIGAVRAEVFHVVVTSPATDLVIDADQVPVLGTLTGTIHQVAPGESF